MRGKEQSGGNPSPPSSDKLHGLSIPEGVAITGMAALATILVGNEIRKRRKKRASQSLPDTTPNEVYRRE